jgi:hypothetical protein
MADHPRDRAIERLLRQPPKAGTAPAGGVCLDAETLAAWMDDALAAEERAAAESHVAGCARCQSLLAAMAKTTPADAGRAAWWRRPLAWAIPLTAATAALVIWVAVPKVGERRAQVVSVPDSESTSRPPASVAAPASPPPRASADAKPGVELETVPQKQLPVEKKDLQGQGAGNRVDRVERSRQSAADERFAAAQAGAAAAAAPPPPAAPAAPSSPVVAGEMAKAMVARAPAMVEIVSSNPGSRWRIVSGATIQRSMDGGSTWQDQQIGVAGPLTAGSSPAPSVCWLVGHGGTVVLTTDGRSWRRLTFPESVDLIAVRATDAQSATVTTADGRTFSSTDSGLTWVPG